MIFNILFLLVGFIVGSLYTWYLKHWYLKQFVEDYKKKIIKGILECKDSLAITLQKEGEIEQQEIITPYGTI